MTTSQNPQAGAPIPPRATPPAPTRPEQATHPLRIAQTLLHLALLGTAGWAVLATFFSVLATGIGLVFVLGIGLVVLVGLIYAMFGLAWFETARVGGLYDLDVTQPTFAKRTRPTFGGWIRSLGRQLKDGGMWAALANFAISATLGALVIPLVQGFIWSIGMIINPASLGTGVFRWMFLLQDVTPTQGRLLGALGIVVTAAAVFGLILLHRTLSVALIGAQAREEKLAAEAQQATHQREGAVRAADVERTRIERDLHDGVQPRLVSVGMTLGLAQQKIDSDPEGAKALLAEAHTSTKAAITELRQLARGIHASVLDDRGLDAALSALAGRSHIPVTLDVRMEGAGQAGSQSTRVARAAESAVYFVIAECLTNAAKHSRANSVRVTVRVRSTANAEGPDTQVLWARVEDDGIGGAELQPGGGLDGITNRVRAAGGTIQIDSPAGGPTAVEVSVPCAF
ncbi:sensor histidine kinase [Leucobacter denitrificans]|uniref:histidine kinase n=1 Tax=Leucobacter denitrificans TaxID=683042 RepID=A0A7G9S780_9MICO|nr:histidine kinase [Leucobacter denitrificans]QNN63705.1 sensor domain-containing protein [Leucobacter denitrificans]